MTAKNGGNGSQDVRTRMGGLGYEEEKKKKLPKL
jgi:hypothetical protein